MRPRRDRKEVEKESKPLDPTTMTDAQAVAAFDCLTAEERAVARMEVDPNDTKPIKWLNEGHFRELIKANAITPELASSCLSYAEIAKREVR